MTASAQQGSIHDQPCTTSTPCQRICGDHVCTPSEVYPSVNNTKMQATAIVTPVPQMPMYQNTTSKSTIMMQNTTSSQSQITSGISSIYDANGTRIVSDSRMCLAGVDTCVMAKMRHAPPIKQMEVGIGALDISCQADFQLVLKAINNMPACVSPSTVNELVKRGWALSQDAMMKEKMMFEPNN
jgi:hypothetical protein